MFNKLHKRQIEKYKQDNERLQERISELETMICPNNSHQWERVKAGEAIFIDGSSIPFYGHRCLKCKAVKI
jgi:hypothetical protein